MLSIAVAGAVFASPPPSSILMALRHVTKTDSGELLIKKKTYNYAYPLAAKFILIQRMISTCQGVRVNTLIIVLKLDV